MSHGRYSRLTRTALERTVTNYIHHNGSASERTRSRTRSFVNPIPRAADSHLTTPSTGSFARTRFITRAAQRRASHRLRVSRIGLHRYLSSNRWEAEFEDLGVSAPTRWLIEQLGTADGFIDALPPSPAAQWDSDVRIASRRARRRAGLSALSVAQCNHPESVLDSEFGVLPGEMWAGDGEDDWEADEDVVRGLTEDGRILEALMDGERMEVVRRCTLRTRLCDGDVDTIAQRASAWRRRREWRVMDPMCIKVVKDVSDMKRP